MKSSQFKRYFHFLLGVLLFSGLAWSNPKTHSINGIPVSAASAKNLIDIQAGFAAITNNQWDTGNQIFTKVTETNPEAVTAWIGLSMSSTSVEQFDHAVTNAEKHLAKATDGEKLIVKLQRTYANGNAEERIKVSKKLIEAYPQSSWAWVERGDALTSVKQNKAARKAFAQAATVEPSDIRPLLRNGNNFLFQEPKDFKKAEYYLTKAVNLQPGNGWAHINLGDAHRAQKKLEKARASYTRATYLEPANHVAFSKKGHANTFLGNFDEARADFVKAAKVGSDVAANFNLNFVAFTHSYENNHAKSLQVLDEHLATIDKSPVKQHQKTQAKVFTLTNMAEIALHTKNAEKAGSVINSRRALVDAQIANVADDNLKRQLRAGNHFWQGRLETVKGELATATKTADKIQILLSSVKDDRKLEGYFELMGMISMKKEQWQKAIAEFDKADKDKLSVKFHQAVAFENTGETKKAYQLYEDVRDNNFNSVQFAIYRNEAADKINAMSVAVGGSK